MPITVDLRPEVVLVPEGDYLVEVEAVELRETRDRSGEYLSFELTIVEGDRQGDMLWMIASLKPSMVRMLRNTLVALGIEDEQITLQVESEELPRGADRKISPRQFLVDPDLVGRRAIATVVHDEWEGELRTKVRRLMPTS